METSPPTGRKICLFRDPTLSVYSTIIVLLTSPSSTTSLNVPCFLLPSSSMTTTNVLTFKLLKDALMATRWCHTLPLHLAYVSTCESQKVPALPEKTPSMTPSQRLPRLMLPLAVSPSHSSSNTLVQRSHTASEMITALMPDSLLPRSPWVLSKK